jgi:Ca2+-binding RTX toxin-like protein
MSSSGTTSPSFPVWPSGDNRIDSLIYGDKWMFKNLTFSFATTGSSWSGYSAGSEPYVGFQPLTSIQQTAARNALSAWSNVCNLTFTEVSEPGMSGVIRFGRSGLPTTSEAYMPNDYTIGGDVWFGTGSSAPDNPIVGTYDYETFLHEIGHALGLKHPHEVSDGEIATFPVADASIDSMNYSVMSYRGYTGASVTDPYSNDINSYAQTPMMDDIAAIQYLYGANYNYNSGNTIYKFTPDQGKIFQTIWDGGGNDTYDLSAYTTSVQVDLRAGGWSTFSSNQLAWLNEYEGGAPIYADGNVANALLYNGNTSSLIENAIGGSGNDTLIGNQVDNILNGGAGADYMTGGLGNDSYVVDNVGDVIVENAGEGTDTVYSNLATYTLGTNLENLVLYDTGNINGTGNSVNNAITGNTGNNILDGGLGADTLIGGAGNDTYVVDNVGDVVVEKTGEGIDTVQSSITYTLGANVENLTLTGTDSLTGIGNELNNVITGNSGNDILSGGLGADTLIGGLGNDSYVVDSSDVIVENVGEGTDTVYSNLVTYTLGTNLENLVLYDTGNINGTGNSDNNVITGNTGNNILTGGAGDDTLDGGLGSDTLIGGVGNDVYVVDNISDVVVENAGEGIDTVQSSITYTLGANVENLTLTGTGNLTGIGNELNNVITGNNGNNILSGGLGADTLIGGLGDDSYVVDSSDVIVENVGEGTDTVYSNLASYTLGTNFENLVLYDTGNINGTGNSVNNVITGNAGNNILDGGLGADTLIGGAGNDTYVVDNVGDVVVEKTGEGIDTVQSSITYTLGANVENLTLTGTDSLTGIGNELNNVITGNSGNDILSGGLGADTLIGGLGNDSYVVDSSDVIVENVGEGTDTVYSNLTTYTLGANLENLILYDTGNINGTGNELNNVITGNNGNNILSGGLGADTLIGGLGDDSYVVDSSDVIVENVGEGTDTVYSNLATYTLGTNLENLVLYDTGNINGTGNSVNNAITGNTGNNILDGGLGADTLIGGAGNDTYVVDNVGDVVVEKTGEGIDTVQSSITYTLGANVENLTLTGTDNLTGIGNELNNVITGNSGNDILSGGLGADTLIGGLGNDSYVVDSSDVIVENVGEGTDTVYSNLTTYTLGANLENLILYDTGNINGTGNELNNAITGNNGNNILSGGLGADTLIGGLGDDSYVVDSSDVIVENVGEGTDTVYSNLATYTLGTNLENLVLYDTGNINGTGNSVNNAITGNTGNNILDGGLGADTLIGGAGNDTYVVDNVGDVVVEKTGEGIDTVQSSITYTLGANVENLTLTGTDNLTGIGNELNNVITGNSGNDILSGGLGADTLIGGLGNDSYVVDSSDVIVENVGEGTDTVYSNLVTYTLGTNLENLVLYDTGNINGTGNSDNNVITGNTGNNILTGGAGDDTLDGGLGSDTLIGGVGNDVYVVDNISDVVVENAGEGIDTVQSSITYTLGANVENLTLTGTGNLTGIGNELNNVITGNNGNNILSGGLGADTLIGGLGDDSYVVDSSDIIVENAGEGTDTVYSNLATYTLGTNLENLVLYDTGNINGTGNSVNNAITGNTGNNILDGGLGADTLIGGAGNDTYVVDNVGDVVVEKTGEGIDTVQSSITYTLGANVENLTLTGTDNLTGIGNELNNVITGNSGNDILSGGLGADTLIGGLGNDSYVVDSSDVIVENVGEGTDTVYSNLVTYTLGTNLENLVLYDTGNINGTGNSDNNVITGNTGNNILTGGAGDDTLDGGLGSDTLIGGVGNDVYVVDNISDVVVENAGEGIDTVQSSITYTLGANVENLTLTGTGNLTGIGNELNNVITGNNGNNILSGGLGADTLIGGLGDDSYVVDSSDVIVENVGEGTDTVYSNLASYTLGSNLENLILYGTDNINGIGNELNNVITANNGNDNLYGGAGNDLLYAGAGNDVLDGGLGNDTYVIGQGSGNSIINSYVGSDNDNGFDTLQFQNMVLSGMSFTKSTNDLICTINQTGKTINLSNWFLGVNYQVDQFQFSDVTLTATQVNQKIV